MTERVVIAGGSGFIGSALAEALVRSGREVVILTRAPRASASGAITEAGWDGKTAGEWVRWLDGAKAVVNLAGRNINCRFTPENRREILESRTDSVRAIGEAIERCAIAPKAWVQASGTGFYGETGERRCDENAPAGHDFLAETCVLWERAFDSAPAPGTRKVALRIGFVLGRDGGALPMLATMTRLFLGGAVGRGRQYVSWIHIADLVRMFEWGIERENVTGVFNAVGPNAVTNAEFMRNLRRALGRPWSPPAPAWAARIGAWAMGSDASLALIGTRAEPRRFAELGLEFRFPQLQGALNDLLRRKI